MAIRRWLDPALRALVVALLIPTAAAAQNATPDCQCRDPVGERRDLGTVECVVISGQSWLVRCEMSSNTPYWKRLNEDAGCPAT